MEKLDVVVNIIASTTTGKGQKLKSRIDYSKTGEKDTDEDLDAVSLFPNEFHGEWYYDIFLRP